jgi:hypothetical protein
MTADERDEWLQNLSLQADVTEIETRDAQAEEAEEEAKSGAEKEDFSECSG